MSMLTSMSCLDLGPPSSDVPHTPRAGFPFRRHRPQPARLHSLADDLRGRTLRPQGVALIGTDPSSAWTTAVEVTAGRNSRTVSDIVPRHTGASGAGHPPRAGVSLSAASR
ncbi:protein of unknown function [Streptantibioticus cattleyicolor NRRL 8057 = DSM 46488]|nr:protein of unknown function [Streptantibioticus cattleyicolor NRRL 8057 = DSM 46488]